ncbi:MAG: hypothetical protein TR69_WS6001001385 [candidate division WS6 bacterium OLB20]|uniref:Uncharacterized protein n=1 Tax=candidate division WS6 bacterium OLB20 TaxID=1617426 RepID=A0A136LWR6_9BACT|nr:MAG: hypothetical protein TR69_WS6001001385 [candidate division WS6 bacterium OLB20]
MLVLDEMSEYAEQGFTLQALQFAALLDYPAELTTGCAALRAGWKSFFESIQIEGQRIDPVFADDLFAVTVSLLAINTRSPQTKDQSSLLASAIVHAIRQVQSPPPVQGGWVQAEQV